MKFFGLAILFILVLISADYLAAKYIVSIGFGYQAPAGVWCIGGILAIRDWVQDVRGLRWSMLLVAIASIISLIISVYTGWAGLRNIAIGSFVAFLFSETADAVIYTPLRQKHRYSGIVLSVMGGAIIDSMIFLWIAFRSFDFLPGQIIGKWEMIPVALILVFFRRNIFVILPFQNKQYAQ